MTEKRIMACDLPLAWELDEEWFNRLEIPEDLRRYYGHISETERQWLESSRLLFEEYRDRRMLLGERTPTSIIRKITQEMDREWLSAGKGRAVDYRNVLTVLDVYACYYAWATVMLSLTPHGVLGLTIPHWMPESLSEQWKLYGGPGFVRVSIELYYPSLGKWGDVQWNQMIVRIDEPDIITPPSRAEFERDPFLYLYADGPASRSFPYGQTPNGLVSWMGSDCARMYEQEKHTGVGGTVFPYIVGNQMVCQDDRFELRIYNPTRDQLQRFLDTVANLLFAHRISEALPKLKFTVSSRMEVEVTAPGEGTFYRRNLPPAS